MIELESEKAFPPLPTHLRLVLVVYPAWSMVVKPLWLCPSIQPFVRWFLTLELEIMICAFEGPYVCVCVCVCVEGYLAMTML